MHGLYYDDSLVALNHELPPFSLKFLKLLIHILLVWWFCPEEYILKNDLCIHFYTSKINSLGNTTQWSVLLCWLIIKTTSNKHKLLSKPCLFKCFSRYYTLESLCNLVVTKTDSRSTTMFLRLFVKTDLCFLRMAAHSIQLHYILLIFICHSKSYCALKHWKIHTISENLHRVWGNHLGDF